MDRITDMGLSLEAATSIVDGAIIIDEFDDDIFDDVLRQWPLWDRIDKRMAPGETTGGFDQTAVGNAASRDPRTLTFSAVSTSVAERTRQTVKAIVMNRQFGLFDRSVGQLQARPFSDLTSKDVSDMVTACLRKWQSQAYTGNATSDATQFNGLRVLLNGDIRTITATSSIANGIDDVIVEMVDQSVRDATPTAIYTSAKVVQYLVREFEAVGDKLRTEQILVNGSPRQVFTLPTAIGMLPLFVDPFNASIAGTPVLYPIMVVTEPLISWQWVPVLSGPNPEPTTFEIALTDTLDQKFASVMFGALDILGGTNHHKYIRAQARSVTVSPV
jgi:hypothetical protein